MSLNEQLTADLKAAMKAKDKTKLSVVRMIKASLTNAKIKKAADLTDEEELQVVTTEMKQRKDSLAEFEKAGREDLSAEVKAEMAIVQNYLPAQLTDEELSAIIQETIDENGATSMKDMGNVMSKLMPKIKGRADGGQVNQLVKKLLS
ncbi:GatB/YqeY domain-containing protein [Lapidilactobacillus mulanensis]|uniref:GatB/YqeY domain-containing protein n=1 Tax=Lapidilactobacillus mulanensis TaxID=2485999 RepID=A0ABW4DR31_9LACO|nr:GatB/YqeY domain-containing protein [Lapidilactobacillus mulanensis]